MTKKHDKFRAELHLTMVLTLLHGYTMRRV